MTLVELEKLFQAEMQEGRRLRDLARAFQSVKLTPKELEQATTLLSMRSEVGAKALYRTIIERE
jgi:hypothetical protein